MALDTKSAANLKNAHTLFQQLIAAVVAAHPKLRFRILESRRGRHDQEKAFSSGHSRAHFGQSAHNWSPAIALDIGIWSRANSPVAEISRSPTATRERTVSPRLVSSTRHT